MPRPKRPRPAKDAGGPSPFRGLDRIVREAGIRLRGPAPPPAPPEPPSEPAPPPSDAEVFAEAMRDTVPAAWRSTVPTEASWARPPATSDDGDDLRMMEAALASSPPGVPLDHPEYIEGWIGIAGQRLLPQLRNGLYSIQGQLDLHGLDRTEARAAVESFVLGMCRFRSCCVKIIHGRGINSPTDPAVLKESLQRWLSTRRMARHVVAYASAPVRDGGVGAVYVLLRP